MVPEECDLKAAIFTSYRRSVLLPVHRSSSVLLVTMVKPSLPSTADLYAVPQESTPVKRSVSVDYIEV
ncbi:VPS10 domain-containing receptor 2-like protein [Labeo rohita]|uniref:VPS10 domain-containing receptor 2-like protein n=1 Tax=Labeo rohita TaxID=84645 RepID=A0A498NQP3_LABRO|nr:VPS10 domain-containing receptor 2-like protein [Labeo rohita]